jgi:hypothetical protein
LAETCPITPKVAFMSTVEWRAITYSWSADRSPARSEARSVIGCSTQASNRRTSFWATLFETP